MKCPLDGADLLITERQGVEIDYCPSCRGVWLDRGELDKLIERADNYDRRDRSKERDDDDDDYRRQNPRGAAPYQGQSAQSPGYAPPRSSTPDIAGMVGEVLKKKLGDGQRGDYDRDYNKGHHGHKKKKGGLLGDLFDF